MTIEADSLKYESGQTRRYQLTICFGFTGVQETRNDKRKLQQDETGQSWNEFLHSLAYRVSHVQSLKNHDLFSVHYT